MFQQLAEDKNSYPKCKRVYTEPQNGNVVSLSQSSIHSKT